MIEFTKFQQETIKTIIKYKPEATEHRFEELFQYVLKKHLGGVGILITSEGVILQVNSNDYSQKYNSLKKATYEIIYLFYLLKKRHLLVFMREEEENENINKKEFEYNPYSNCLENISVKTLIEYRKNILLNLEEEFFISGELKLFSKNGFQSIEVKNLKITQFALWFTVGLGIAGIIADYYIAKTIPTEIKFKNPDDLEKNINIDIKLEENFIKNTRLKLKFQEDVNK